MKNSRGTNSQNDTSKSSLGKISKKSIKLLVSAEPTVYNLGELISKLEQKHIYGIKLVIDKNYISLEGK